MKIKTILKAIASVFRLPGVYPYLLFLLPSIRAVHSADPVRESLTSSVRDDFDIRDYSRQDLFFETGYESELITTINLINSEKGFKNSF